MNRTKWNDQTGFIKKFEIISGHCCDRSNDFNRYRFSKNAFVVVPAMWSSWNITIFQLNSLAIHSPLTMNWFFLIKVLGCYTTVHVFDMEVYFKVDCSTSEWIYLNSQPWRICLKSTLRIWTVILEIKWFKWFELIQSNFTMTAWYNSHSFWTWSFDLPRFITVF